MNIKINGLNINYIVEGESNKEALILLHGWGASSKAFLPVYKNLSNKYKVYVIDLPGFGKSDEPPKNYGVIEYSKIVLEFITKLKIQSPTLIGHSFGGRVIMKLVSDLKYTPKKIIFVDSAGIKPKRNIDYYFKVYSYKFAKNIVKFVFNKDKADEIIANMRKNKGSSDYKEASENMRSVFVNVVNEDLKYTLKNINVPTLVIWGENDLDTPLNDAKIITKYVKDSGLVVLKGAGHFSYLDNLWEFLIIVDNFLEGSDKND